MPAESVGETAAASLVTDIQSGGCVDSYLQDQVCTFPLFLTQPKNNTVILAALITKKWYSQ